MVDKDIVTMSMDETIEHLKNELKKIKAGRANPGLVKDMTINAYGSKLPLEQVANINIVDATLLTVQPWDKTVVKDVVKAIQTSDIGINPSVDGDLIRLPIPQLTSERREEYIKLMKKKIEDAKISVRQKRKEFMNDIETDNDLSEDDRKRSEGLVQKIVDDTNEKIDNINEQKFKELTKV